MPPSTRSPPTASTPRSRHHLTAPTTFGRHGSSTLTATASSWSSGRPATRTASARPTGLTDSAGEHVGKTFGIGEIDQLSVDEHGRCRCHAAADATALVRTHRVGERSVADVLLEPLDIQTECRRVSGEIRGFQSVLMREQQIVHLPEILLIA